MYKLSKSFDFCYGHRVYSQDVVAKYAGNSDCPCHRIHGHQGKASIHMEAAKLDHRDFVIDFKELGFVKRFLDDNIDHRFIVSTKDPEFERLVGISVDGIENHVRPVYLLDGEVLMGYRIIIGGVDEHLDSFFVVDFNPTSEKLAEWLYCGIHDLITRSPFGCHVDYVEWSETPKTSAVYGE